MPETAPLPGQPEGEIELVLPLGTVRLRWQVCGQSLRMVIDLVATPVITLPSGTQVWLAAGITDMRRGMHGLAALVETTLAMSPYSGHVFVFRGRRGDLLKVLWADRDGLCLFMKRWCSERRVFLRRIAMCNMSMRRHCGN